MYLEKEKNKVIWLIVALISLTSVTAANPNIDVIIITPDDSADIGVQVAPNSGITKEVIITAEVTDLDGVDDIKGVKSTTPFGVITLNKISNIDSDTGSYANSFDMNFYDAPITYPIKVTAEDNNGNKAYDITSFDYLESITVELDSNTINFLNVNPAGNSIVTGDNDISTLDNPTIQNYGNTIIDAEIYGSDLSSGSNTILVNNVQYTFVDQDWDNELAGILDYSSERKNIGLYYGVMETNEANYKLYVPSGTVPGSYSGTVTITAVQGTGNRAPVLHYIEDIIAAEGDLVKITPSATDLDEDSLTYTFTSPLDSNGEWQTQSGDEGVYTATVTVSDSNLEDSQNVIITILFGCEDADGDGYDAITPSCPTGNDCDDNNPDVYPDATEVCNGIDDDCDESIDEGGNALCDDYVFCNGKETCRGIEGCQPGTPIDCSGDNLAEIATCSNNPDNNPFTWDYFAGFTSTCDEATDSCTAGTVDLTHSCSIEQCSAECETDADCEDNTCSETYNDYCDNKKLVEYDNDKIKDSTTVTDSCTNTCLADCTSTDCDVDCSAPSTNTYCVKDVCDAECAVDADCNDDDAHTTDVCQNCVCEYQSANNDPTIDSFTPEDTTPEIDEGESLTFTVTASDSDGDELTYLWELDGEEASTTTSYTYSPGYEDSGSHTITVTVSDSFGTDSQQWNVNVNEAGEVFEQSLVIDWNTVTLTVHPFDTVVANVLSSIEGKYDNVWAEVNGEWLSYSPTVLPLMNTLTYLDETTTFHIEMNQAATLTVIGSPLIFEGKKYEKS